MVRVERGRWLDVKNGFSSKKSVFVSIGGVDVKNRFSSKKSIFSISISVGGVHQRSMSFFCMYSDPPASDSLCIPWFLTFLLPPSSSSMHSWHLFSLDSLNCGMDWSIVWTTWGWASSVPAKFFWAPLVCGPSLGEMERGRACPPGGSTVWGFFLALSWQAFVLLVKVFFWLVFRCHWLLAFVVGERASCW